MRILLISLLSISIFSACQKAVESDPIPKVPPPPLTINGITETDITGNVLSIVDSTDWTNDLVWNANEKALFNFSDTLNYTNILDSVPVTFNPVYPNPIDSTCTVQINADNSTIYKAVLVDENYTPLIRLTRRLKDNGSDAFHLNTNNLKLKGKVRFLRMYYAFYTSSKVIYYKGHGDLKLKAI